DLPPTTGDNGYAGFGSSLSQVPLWMCTGCALDGAPSRFKTTFVCLSPLLVSVAVPDSLELLCGSSLTVTESAACRGATPPISTNPTIAMDTNRCIATICESPFVRWKPSTCVAITGRRSLSPPIGDTTIVSPRSPRVGSPARHEKRDQIVDLGRR